jgi:two-component system, OmpR family, heavy metal sensor histidine kinase CusS
MRSIRISLLVYFFALFALGLGGVCLLTYRIAAATIHDKEISSKRLLETEVRDRTKEIRDGLDQELLRKANLVIARHHRPPRQDVMNALGLLTAPTVPNGLLNVLVEARIATPGKRWTPGAFRLPSLASIMGSLLADDDDESPREFCQTFYLSGQPWERTGNLLAESMPLDREHRKMGDLPAESFDSTTVNGIPVRCVTLPVHHPFVPPSDRPPTDRPDRIAGDRRDMARMEPGDRPVGDRQRDPGGKFRPGPGANKPFVEPFYYLQYGVETSNVDHRIRMLDAERNRRLHGLDDDVHRDLSALRSQLLLISSLTLSAVLFGAFCLVWLGLLPLHRLSDAVSQISPRDFALKINPASLPAELQPIAVRLSQTLDQLQKAFAREKQSAQDISHDLRTPLAALATTIEVGLKKTRTPAEYREILEDCQVSADQMAHLVNRLMALARIDAGTDPIQPRDVDLSLVAQHAADLVKPLAKAQGIELSVDVPESLFVRVDPDKVCETLTNLLHNAVDYNRPGGSIALSLNRSADWVELTVADTGIGIRPEARVHLFERFFRADPSRHSDTPHCGLGLAIVKSYVGLMNGTIDVDSELGVGTTFRIRIPFVAGTEIDDRIRDGSRHAAASF